VSYGGVVMSWAAEEFKTIDLGDRRLNKSAILLAERLAANPMASIPQACGGWAETQAARTTSTGKPSLRRTGKALRNACAPIRACCAYKTPRN